MAEEISWKKVLKADSDFIGEWDLPSNKDVVVTIKDAVQEEVLIPSKNVTKTSLVLTFNEFAKKFICNKTNAVRISTALKTDKLSEWVGKRIQIYSDHTVKFGTQLVSAIRVRPKAPASSEPEYRCPVCGKLITKERYDSSIEKYGKPYCSQECLEKDKLGQDIL